MRSHHARGGSLFVLAALALGCGDDHPKQKCMLSLDEWCANGACDSQRTFDDVLRNPPPQLILSDCGDRRQLGTGRSLFGWKYTYDAKSGQLIGTEGWSDQEDLGCPNGRSGGDTRVDGCTTCVLSGDPTGKTEACTGELARPFVDACIANPPSVMKDCVECGCAHCYPVLVLWETVEADASVATAYREAAGWEALTLKCVYDHCGGCEPAQQ
jgi:hypothetical protein